MNRLCLLLILSTFLMIGCAHRVPHSGEPMLIRPQAADLWELKIVHREVPKFSGIMGLEKRERGVYCVVLDATGVPLLEGVVTSPTEMEVTRCLEELRRRRFPELMSRVVGALYLTPLEPSCPWYAWGCAQRRPDGDGVQSVVYRLGFFTGWRAESRIEPDSERAGEMKVSFPWGGVDVFLKKMKEDNGVH